MCKIRSRSRVKLDLSKGINIFVGKNNSGKSTLIRSVYKIQNDIALNKEDIRIGCDYSRIIIELFDINEREKKLFYNRELPDIYPRNQDQTLMFNLFRNKDHKNERIYYDVYPPHVDLSQVSPVHPLPVFPDSEENNNLIFPFLAKRKMDYYSGVGGKQEAFRAEDSFRNLASRVQKNDTSASVNRKRYEKLCQEILGFNIGIVANDEQNQSNRTEIGRYVSHTEAISIRSMGEGVSNILGMITNLLTDDRKLYLIEELENDIHPSALKKLLQLIIEKSGENQFIISTHSNIVLKYLGGVPNAKIFYVDWQVEDENENGGEKLINVSTVKEVENTPASRLDILEKLGYEFYDLELYEAYLILEESSAEQIIKWLIPTFCPQLVNRLKTIAARGAADLEPRVIDFHRLFVYVHASEAYFKKAWVIADGDRDGLDCINKLKNDFKSWPSDHFINWSKLNFEEYYPEQFLRK